MDQKKTYEGMFIVDAGGDYEAAAEPVRTVLSRSEAEVLAMKPWDERKLAYEIKGRRRGLYVLTYFKADAEKIASIEHDCQFSEQILRALVLRKDHVTEEEINAETPLSSGRRRSEQRSEEGGSTSGDSERGRSERPSSSRPEAGERGKEREEGSESSGEPASAEPASRDGAPDTPERPEPSEASGDEESTPKLSEDEAANMVQDDKSDSE